MEWEIPVYAHIPLIHGEDGKYEDDNERRKLWKQIFSDEDFIKFASKFRPLVLSQENKLMTQAPWVEM